MTAAVKSRVQYVQWKTQWQPTKLKNLPSPSLLLASTTSYTLTLNRMHSIVHSHPQITNFLTNRAFSTRDSFFRYVWALFSPITTLSTADLESILKLITARIRQTNHPSRSQDRGDKPIPTNICLPYISHLRQWFPSLLEALVKGAKLRLLQRSLSPKVQPELHPFLSESVLT